MSSGKEKYIARDAETCWENEECFATSDLNGAKLLLDVLEDEGVEVIFGYPGGSLLTLYDALLDSPIKHVLPDMNRLVLMH
jgi:acetolactate synthase-1/2/3 large subunit